MIFSYITKYKPNIDSMIDCYKPLMSSNNKLFDNTQLNTC